MFEYRSNVISFYSHIFYHPESLQLLVDFLKNLAYQMPLKLKEYFLKAIKADREKYELFNAPSPLLRILCENFTVEQTASMLRDMSMIIPSKGFLSLLSRLMSEFKDSSKQMAILKNCLARLLNLILIRNHQS